MSSPTISWHKAIIDIDGFYACMDVGQFKPSELRVKLIDDFVEMEGKHKNDLGLVSRYYFQRHKLPKGYNPDKVVATLSTDGVLRVSVPKPAFEDLLAYERIVQIQQVGSAYLNMKQNPEEDDIHSLYSK